uniref:Triacylglycerol lipase n=1 Tax=Plectus sambesii TaxID=2011161 RepID=A0A914W3U7_9BILA
MRSLQFLALHCAAFMIVSGDFTPDFNAFLTNTYGPAMQNRLERKDLQDRGSFGGRAAAGQKLKRQPVILVHGITNSASQFRDIGQHFGSNGYDWAEIYATTWGDAGKTVFFFVDLKCDYVKQVRSLIQAVNRYTRKKVDVIGYSMGSPIARKAIMGGFCVDTGENLGPPLTRIVDTFVAVAGANNASSTKVK